MKTILRFLSAFFFAGAASAQTLPPITLPTIYFDAPPGLSGGGDEVAAFSTPERDLVIYVYPFRRLGPGDFQARFRDNQLREFIAGNLREAKPATPPQIQPASVEGAEAAVTGRFNDGKGERSRLAILAAGAVAIVDVTATSAAALEKHAGAVKEMLDSLSVGQPKARAAPPPVLAAPSAPAPVAAAPAAATAAASAAAPAAPPAAAPLPAFMPGLYIGNVRRLIPQFVGGVQSGGMWVTGPQWILLSNEGLAYRTYDKPRGSGDPERFDYRRAQVSDAGNTGSYQVLGNDLTLRFGNETITAKLAGPGRFDIFGAQFKRTAKP